MSNELAHDTHVLTVRAARGTARGKAKMYCPIRLVQTHFSLLGALVSLGLNNDNALSLIEEAKHKRRRYVFAGLGNNECFVVVPDSRGEVQIWEAMIGQAKPRRDEAEAFILAQRAELQRYIATGCFSARRLLQGPPHDRRPHETRLNADRAEARQARSYPARILAAATLSIARGWALACEDAGRAVVAAGLRIA